MRKTLILSSILTLTVVACGGNKSESGGGGGDGDGDGDMTGDGDGDMTGDGDGDMTGDGDGDMTGDGDGDMTGDGDGDMTGDGDGDIVTVDPPEALAIATADYPGLETLLDATPSSGEDLSYTWSFDRVPEGSTLGDDDITGGQSASFVADLSGTYVITLTVTQGELDDSSTFFVDVPAAHVPHIFSRYQNDALTMTPMMIQSDGQNHLPIGCPVLLPDTNESESFEISTLFGVATSAVSTTAGGEEKLVYSHPDENNVYFANTTTNCGANPPTMLEGGIGFGMYYSPNGSRLVGQFGPDPGNLVLGTIGSLAEDPRPMGDVAVNTDGLQVVGWAGDAHIILRPDGDLGTLLRIEDTEDGVDAPDVLLDCSIPAEEDRLDPYKFQYVDGVLFIIHEGDLYRLEGTDDVFDCDITSNQNTLIAEDGAITTFEVSPDGSVAAFISGGLPSDSSTGVSLVDAFGASPPLPLALSPAVVDTGLHWISDGKQLVWSRTTTEDDEAVARAGAGGVAENPERVAVTRIFRVNADGNMLVEILRVNSTEASTVNVIIGGCSYLPLSSGGGAGALLLLSAGSLLARRRRRRLS